MKIKLTAMNAMRIVLVIFMSLIVCADSEAQIFNPVHWSYTSKKIGDRKAVVLIKARIDKGWHIYSMNQNENGPLKTSFEFISSPGYYLIDNITEPQPIKKYEKSFGMNVHYFEDLVIFRQKVMLTSKDAVVSGKIKFMACNNKQCLPEDEVLFRISIK